MNASPRTPIAASYRCTPASSWGLPKEDLEHRLRAMKDKVGVKEDTAVPASGWKDLVAEYKAFFREKTGKDFPEDPMEQLWGAIGAVFGSWMAEKAVTYRRVEKITGLLGTAVNVVQMVFGNTGDTSGTGVCFTRDPSSGETHFLWRLSGQRPRRGRGRGHPHADAPDRNEEADAQGLRAARKSSRKT